MQIDLELVQDEVIEAWNNFVSGDNDAVKTVYQKHHSVLVFQAFHFLKDETRAQDVVADIFVKLLEMTATERFEQLSNVNTKLEVFLKVLVKNKCLDQLRIENNRKTILGGINSFFIRSTKNHEPTDSDLQVMLDILPAQQRNILKMHLEGYDNTAISEALNISYNTCRNTLSTAKKRMRGLWTTFMN